MNTYSNFYSRVQNAQRAGDALLQIPWSHKVWRLAIFLKRLKYIEDFEINTPEETPLLKDRKYFGRNSFKKGFPNITLHLIPGGFSHLQQVSKPSRRVIRKAKDINIHRKPYGSFIVSTNSGLLSCQEAKAMNLGGELMCEIY